MSKRTAIFALAAVAIMLPALASANGLNLNGLGTRAQAMGGAYVSLADDFSAVFWNPAGAAGFRRTTFGFCALDLIPTATYKLISLIPEVPTVDAKTKTSHYLGFLAGYYKPISSKVVLGLGIGTPSGLGTMWDGADFANLTSGTTYDWSSKIGVLSFSPLVAVKLSDIISVGATVNFNYGMFSRKMPVFAIVLEGLGQYEENMNGWGIGATFGVLVTPSEKLGFGLTVRTPSTVALNGTASMPDLSYLELPGSSELERKITWPLWIAGGVSFRPIPRLLLSADAHWTQWSRLDRFTTDYQDSFWVTLMEDAGMDEEFLGWKDTLQLRFGAEYALNPSTVLRAGYYNDPAPGPYSPLNVFLPTHTFSVLTLGAGKSIGDLQLDFGLEYMMGKKRGPGDHFIWDYGTYGMKIVVPSVSSSYKF